MKQTQQEKQQGQQLDDDFARRHIAEERQRLESLENRLTETGIQLMGVLPASLRKYTVAYCTPY